MIKTWSRDYYLYESNQSTYVFTRPKRLFIIITNGFDLYFRTLYTRQLFPLTFFLLLRKMGFQMESTFLLVFIVWITNAEIIVSFHLLLILKKYINRSKMNMRSGIKKSITKSKKKVLFEKIKYLSCQKIWSFFWDEMSCIW